MKQLILFFAIIVYTKDLKSQSWCPQGAVWYFNHWDILHGNGYLKWTYQGSNILIDGKNCDAFAIERYTQSGPVSVSGYFTYFNNNVVYYVPTVGSIKDTLFDFNAKPGDIWRMARTTIAECANGKVIVLDTGTNIIQGIKLRWLKVNYVSSKKNLIDVIYERFGALSVYPYNWFNVCPSGTDGEYGGSLRCYSDNQIFNYVNDPSKACDEYNGVGINTNINEARHLKAYPNPTINFLNINFQNSSAIENYEIKLIDVLGVSQILNLNKSKEIGEIRLDLRALQNGIYFLQVWDRGKLVGNEKVIKD
ncbi:MAG: T9SS type A sorting domain-containing protein [Bacteroidota bacterium]